MPSEPPEPTFKDILRSIKRIVDEAAGRLNLSPGLLLMVAVAAVIAVAAFVKNLQQN